MAAIQSEGVKGSQVPWRRRALIILFLVAWAWLWATSYSARWSLAIWTGPTKVLLIGPHNGAIYILTANVPVGGPRITILSETLMSGGRLVNDRVTLENLAFELCGFAFGPNPPPSARGAQFTLLPLWLPLLLAAIVPLWQVLRRVRQSRRVGFDVVPSGAPERVIASDTVRSH
jgi:hypothetical protein